MQAFTRRLDSHFVISSLVPTSTNYSQPHRYTTARSPMQRWFSGREDASDEDGDFEPSTPPGSPLTQVGENPGRTIVPQPSVEGPPAQRRRLMSSMQSAVPSSASAIGHDLQAPFASHSSPTIHEHFGVLGGGPNPTPEAPNRVHSVLPAPVPPLPVSTATIAPTTRMAEFPTSTDCHRPWHGETTDPTGISPPQPNRVPQHPVPMIPTPQPLLVSGVPAEVAFAVSNYQPKAGFELVAQGPTERSCIYKWGVRVRHVSDLTVCGWICLASEHCRSNESVHVLYGGKTSRATKHLKEVHHVTSSKSALEDSRKRTRDEIVDRIRAAAQNQESCERISLLLHTLLVIHNNLPFIMGEWEESRILRAIVTKDSFQAVVNRRTITHAVIELYVSAKRELIRFIIDNRIPGVKCLVMVADFWKAKSSGTKFLGLRLYFVTADFKLVSVLLGTRHFQPLYGERDGGIRGPFKRWIIQILADFGLTVADFFGATTDGGPDVQHMMTSNLMLSWEWCMPHLTNAATKAAFGMTSNVAKSKNPEMLQLLKKVTQTVYQVRTVEVMGDLYEQLVRLLGVGKEKKLIDYKPHRFMSLTRVFERIVKHWNVLCLWYEERARKADRDKSAPPSPFPLAGDKLLMEQLLSLMLPISALNVKSQAEKPNQVDVLVSAYKVIVTTLGPEASLRKYDATRENPTSYHHSTLMPLVVKTRELLSDAFHSRFFSRYTDREVMRTCSYVWEMQMLLHPNLKQPDGALMEMVKTCGKLRRLDDDVIRRNQSVVKSTVKQKLRSIMRDLAPPCTEQINISPQQIPGYVSDAFSDDLSELFNIRTIAAEPATPQLLHEEVMDEELERWFRDPSLLQAMAKGPESVLHFWKRQQESGTYRFLPSAARIVFAVPASSAQIERDFGISGQMVTVQRASLSSENIDMCSFLNRNREFIDVTQCSKLTAEEARDSVPANVTVNLDPQTAMEMFESDWEQALVNSFSAHISTEL